MIRVYTPEDKEALVELLRLNTPEYFHPEEEKDFVYYLENHAQNYFVVEDAGRIVGAGGINYLHNGREVRLSWDIVHPDLQGKGIGSSLTRYRIARIKSEADANAITVRTTQFVYQFYQKLGFTLVKTEKNFWAEGFDLYEMELKIK